MYPLFRPLVFKLDPETAHQLTLQLVRLGAYQPFYFLLKAMYSVPGKPVEAFGLNFPNPVGLAAGYDKDAIAWRGLAALGFGHIEVGTVTPLPQQGNPKPRVFRLVQERAVINSMGFPGKGAAYVARRLLGSPSSSMGRGSPSSSMGRGSPSSSMGRGSPSSSMGRDSPGSSKGSHLKASNVLLGVNLGKNKDTPLEAAAEDYISLVRQFSQIADYLAINVSSPNTIGLRRLQGREMLESLLGAIAREREDIALGRGGHPPILVKIAPDLSNDELDDALEVIVRTGMNGVIATNTTLGRSGLKSKHPELAGGLSGEPLGMRSMAVLKAVVKKLNGRLPVVSVGGIMSPADAQARLDAGASLVQIYTGLVYAGPGLVKQILQKL
jgi:dihydroorotate dehydrogenase